MPLFLDVQTFGTGVAAADLVRIGGAEPDGRFGVTYLRCWVSEPAGKVFRLVEADDPDLVASGHRRTAGLVAHEIYPVSEHTRPRLGTPSEGRTT